MLPEHGHEHSLWRVSRARHSRHMAPVVLAAAAGLQIGGNPRLGTWSIQIGTTRIATQRQQPRVLAQEHTDLCHLIWSGAVDRLGRAEGAIDGPRHNEQSRIFDV